ncbi:MAG TPA: complex I NDUFA9 subunit family protein [Candidatus Hypogeohydataceae bacterium YC41]
MILVTGGTGFVGRNIVRKLIQEGQPKVRCLVRRTSKREVLENLPIEFCEGDITEPSSLESAVKDIEVVIHLPGIIRELPPDVTYEKIHSEGTSNVVAASVKAGVKKFVHMSALGTRPDAPSRYHTTKWAGEQAVKSSGLPYVIFRPSIICGKDDEFVNMFANLIRQTWPLPFPVIASGQTRLQPIYIGDVAHCFVKAALDPKIVNKTYELGGPEKLTIDEVLDTIMKVLETRRIKIHVPLTMVWPMAYMMEKTCSRPMLTREQLIMLQCDNTCDITPMKKDFGLEPMRFEEAIRTYLKP